MRAACMSIIQSSLMIDDVGHHTSKNIMSTAASAQLAFGKHLHNHHQAGMALKAWPASWTDQSENVGQLLLRLSPGSA